FACGLPLSLDRMTYAPGGAFGADFASIGLLGAQKGALDPSLYLLALLPLACAFAGGWVAARVAGVPTQREGMRARALIVLPLGFLTALVAMLATLNIQATLPLGALIVDATPSAGTSALLSLALLALAGALGGRSAVTHTARGASQPVQRGLAAWVWGG